MRMFSLPTLNPASKVPTRGGTSRGQNSRGKGKTCAWYKNSKTTILHSYRVKRQYDGFQREIGDCNEDRCTLVRCTIGNLVKGELVTFKIRSRLFTETQINVSWHEKVAKLVHCSIWAFYRTTPTRSRSRPSSLPELQNFLTKQTSESSDIR